MMDSMLKDSLDSWMDEDGGKDEDDGADTIIHQRRLNILAQPLAKLVPNNAPSANRETPRGVTVDWNLAFQKAVDDVNQLSLNHSDERRVLAFSRLGQLYQNFVDTATLYGKIIISELYLPESSRTIKPTLIGGVAGGQKFAVQNILFKLCTDHAKIFGSETHAQKLASHELKGLIGIFNHGSSMLLRVPMMCVLIYKGCRMIAMSMLPVHGDQTIAYGSRDVGKTVHTNEDFHGKLKKVATELGLKSHEVIQLKDHQKFNIYTPVDLEGHIGSDNNQYIIDFSRLFPPEEPDPEYKAGHLFRLLRPEFVKIYSRIKGPLSPDAFSGFVDSSVTIHNEEIKEATTFLHTKQIPDFVEYLKEMNALDPFAWLTVYHRFGINFRHLGLVRQQVMKAGVASYSQWTYCQIMLIEIVARCTKNLLGGILRAHINDQLLPGDELLKIAASDYLNIIFGKSEDSANYWANELRSSLLEQFPNALGDYENPGENIRGTDAMCLLFTRTVYLCGISLTASAMERFKSFSAFNFLAPISDSDIESFVARSKTMSLAAYADGYTLQVKAHRADTEPEAKRFYRLAVEKFKKALEMEPANIHALNQIAEAMSYLGHPQVVSSVFGSVMALEPGHFDFLQRYGQFKYSMGEIMVAQDMFLQSLEQDANFAVALSHYAALLGEALQLPEISLKFHERALSLAPTSEVVVFNYTSYICTVMKNPELANKFFQDHIHAADFCLVDYPLLSCYVVFLQKYSNDEELIKKYQHLYEIKQKEFHECLRANQRIGTKPKPVFITLEDSSAYFQEGEPKSPIPLSPLLGGPTKHYYLFKRPSICIPASFLPKSSLFTEPLSLDEEPAAKRKNEDYMDSSSNNMDALRAPFIRFDQMLPLSLDDSPDRPRKNDDGGARSTMRS